MRLEDFDTSKQYQADLVSSERITEDEAPAEVKELIFQIKGPNFHYELGQLVGVLVPGPHEFGHDTHFRLYTIANEPQSQNQQQKISLCVRRCNYIDEYSGEQYQGIASNYLCNLQPGASVTISGPYGLPFEVPDDNSADILMIGMGTGIAPFRAFIKHIYHNLGDWQGKVRLFYGAHTGLEMLYMNDKRNDFANYYDEDTFKAFQAISPRPLSGEPVDFEQSLQQHQVEVWEMLCRHTTYVYIAGLDGINESLDKVFSKMAGSEDKWQRRKAELIAGKRWTELLY
ncbi:FAD-binding oxidoreductase [Kaarinaea lacus]